jgi:hypothetical protein
LTSFTPPSILIDDPLLSVREVQVDRGHQGTSQALIRRFVDHRLPQIMKIRDHVFAGKKLTDSELDIMSRIVKQARDFGTTAREFPEFQPLIAKTFELYEEIIAKALDNETQS